MNRSRIYKTLVFFAFIIELVIFFMLYGKVQNLCILNNIATQANSIFLLLALAFVFISFIFFVSIINLSRKKSDIGSDHDNSNQLEKTRQQVFEDDKKEETLDLENYLTKIVPKETGNLDLEKYAEKILSNIAKEFDIVQGLFFVKEKNKDIFNIKGKYAYFGDEEPKSFNLGETISGQVAKNKTVLNMEEIPEGYITILSGLGSSSPNHLVIIPIVAGDKTIAIIELASFKKFRQNFIELFNNMSEQIGKALLKF